MEFIENLTNTQKIIMVVVVLLGSWMLYNQFLAPKNAQENMISYPGAKGNPDVLKCTMYYVNWCPHCTSAKPHWNKLEQEMNGAVVNGKKILITKVDCEANPEVAKAQNITGYPTFKFDMNEKHFEYQDEAVFDKMKTYIRNIALSQ